MRLGEQSCRLTEGSKSAALYGTPQVLERHRHRYEFNNQYRDKIAAQGLVFAGYSEDDALVEIIELPDHPWFVGCQFHPEFTSTPRAGHPLFIGFIQAARAHAQAQADDTEQSA